MGGPMTDLAPHLTAFLQQHLPNERRFSRHTVQSYTECFRLLVLYAAEQIKVRPCALKIEHFTVALLLAFLESLEKVRNNSVGTRNIRLAAIKSFFRYVEYRVPSCLDHALQVRAIPQKRADKPLIDWLDRTEMQAILDAPDTATVAGLRDRAMLHLCYAAGLRVSELTGLTLDSLSGPGLETIRILGKGRRDRELPLWRETKTVLNEWLDVRPPVNNRYLFLNAPGAGDEHGWLRICPQAACRHGGAEGCVDQGQAGHPACAPSFHGDDDPACHRGYTEGLVVARPCGHQDHRGVSPREPGRETGSP